MKKLILNVVLFSFAVSTTFFSGCEKIFSHALDINAECKEVTLTITPTTKGFFDLDGSVPIDIDALAKEHKFKKEKLSKVRLTECIFTIVDTDPKPYTFNLVKEVWGYATSTGKTNLQIIGDYDIQRSGESSIGVNVIDVDFKDFIDANNFNLNVHLVLKDTIKHEFKINAKMKYYAAATSTNPTAK